MSINMKAFGGTDTSKKSLTKSDKRILCESDWQLASGNCPLPIACDCIVPPDQCGGQKMVVPDHIGGGQEGEADRAGEQDGSNPHNLLTITVQVNT